MFDDLALWTGSAVRHLDGRWFMLYIGSTLVPAWARTDSPSRKPCRRPPRLEGPGPVVPADSEVYQASAPPPEVNRHAEAFRDPSILRGPDGTC